MNVRYVLPCAGLLAIGACASTSKQASESPNPTTREVASSQQASEQALKRAAESQKAATEQSQKSAEAQARVRNDQEKLRQDQETARQEQAKAEQLQLQANQESKQATQQAQQQQQRAASALSQQTQDVSKGQQVAAGLVTQVRPDEVVVQPPSGQAMRIRINDSTQVKIHGRTSTADQIQEGQQARVAYEPSVNGPTAVTISVSKAGATGDSSTGSSGSTGTGSSSSGSSGTSQPPPEQTPSQGGGRTPGY
ncbi:hypothetical protein [Anaeromyxobacter diazotrophicus]|uniref:Lipoprotein n=1 Tax=Anaeromyxobacter diazotrophicus TaxID=2590199 RepID=A0A7I9VQW1_9BACT|nr:hypothetical protein [Anaeromyxobacter diazotrophicus]GEJ58785.1 hypothetical protein AMYX_35260 [Anaeromyxobacter diazotrophicus]